MTGQRWARSLGGAGPQRFYRDFLEEDYVVIAVVLQANVAVGWPWAALRFEIEFLFGHGLALGVVGDFDVVDCDNRARAIERDLHGVPLGAGFARFSKRFSERIKSAGDVVFVFIAGFGVIVDLHFVAIVDGHPRFGGSKGDAYEDPRVVIFVAHFVDDSDDAITELRFGPIEEPHAAVSVDKPVFDGHFTGADMLPAIEILAVEELSPFGSAVGEWGKSAGEE